LKQTSHCQVQLPMQSKLQKFSLCGQSCMRSKTNVHSFSERRKTCVESSLPPQSHRHRASTPPTPNHARLAHRPLLSRRRHHQLAHTLCFSRRSQQDSCSPPSATAKGRRLRSQHQSCPRNLMSSDHRQRRSSSVAVSRKGRSSFAQRCVRRQQHVLHSIISPQMLRTGTPPIHYLHSSVCREDAGMV
jgi:hypothetical protein